MIEPTLAQVLAAAWWVRAGVTTDVARGLVGATPLQWDVWIERGRHDRNEQIRSRCALLVARLELAEALRRSEVLRRLHGFVMADPRALLEYLARRWPDAFADATLAALAIAPTAGATASRSLVDHVMDAIDASATDVGPGPGPGDAGVDDAGGAGLGCMVGDQPGDPHDR